MNDASIFDGRRRWLVTVLVALFLLAAGVRLVKLDAPGVLVDRDYTSAMFARHFYFQHADDIEPWRRENARATYENQPRLEPPATEWLVSLLYRLAGAEDLRLARLLTSSFWLLGGWFLYRTAQRLVSTDAAVFALAYYLFLPHSILLSRSFQADALMMLGFTASLYLIVRFHEAPTTRALLTAGLLGAATLVYRPLVLPALVGAFVVPVMQRKGILRGAVDRTVLAYVALAALPAVLYYGYATFVADYFGWKLTSSFRFHLLAYREFWAGWHEAALLVAMLLPLLMAACGTVLLRTGLPRSIVVGLALGYVAFGLLFTMHIHTHDYYSAQLIPIVAIAASPVAVLLARHFVAAPGMVLKVLAAMLIVALAGWPAIKDWRDGLTRAKNESPAIAREIGRLVDHSPRVVFLSRYYGLSLQYFGEFTGAYWPRPITYWLYRTPGERELTVGERLAALPFTPDYFVITAFQEFERHHRDLAEYLETRCVLKARSPLYLVYGECRPPD